MVLFVILKKEPQPGSYTLTAVGLAASAVFRGSAWTGHIRQLWSPDAEKISEFDSTGGHAGLDCVSFVKTFATQVDKQTPLGFLCVSHDVDCFLGSSVDYRVFPYTLRHFTHLKVNPVGVIKTWENAQLGRLMFGGHPLFVRMF